MISRSGGSCRNLGVDLLHEDTDRAGNPPRIPLGRGAAAHVHDHRRVSLVEEPLQLGNADPGHPEELVEAAALPPLPTHEERQRPAGDHERPETEPLEVLRDAIDRAVEDHPRGDARSPHRSAPPPSNRRNRAKPMRTAPASGGATVENG
jgi:hypothetical protein